MNVEKIREDFPALQQVIKGKPPIYFDNACMPMKPRQVLDAMMEYYEKYPACAGRSNHQFSHMTEQGFVAARKSMKEYLGAKKAEEIVFTRNTTEGINLVANSLGFGKGDVVITSDREHNSNLVPWLRLRDRAGIVHKHVPPLKDTTFDIDAFSGMMSKDVKLVSVVHTSNLDGYTLPVKEIGKIAHEHGALFMLDGAQAAPHKDVDVRKLGADFYALSGHKMLGPTGTGALYGRMELLEKMEPFLTGGETIEFSTYDSYKMLPPPEKFEAGLQDYAGIIGMGAAARYLMKIGRDMIGKHEIELNRIITDGIKDIPGLRIMGPQDPGMRAGIAAFTLEGMDYHQIALLLDSNANIMIRSGQHCVHSWFSANGIKGSARATLYLYNTKHEAEVFIEELKKIAELR